MENGEEGEEIVGMCTEKQKNMKEKEGAALRRNWRCRKMIDDERKGRRRRRGWS